MASKEDDYCAFINSALSSLYPDFVHHLASQDDVSKEEEGRLAIIEFQDNCNPVVRGPLGTSADLVRYLDTCVSSSPTTTARRVFVLEGLPKAYIRVLGSRLKVPPSFFAQHWQVDKSGMLLNRAPRQYERHNRFSLSMTRFHRAKIRDDDKLFYYMKTSLGRRLSRLTIFGDFGGPLSSLETVYFWSIKRGQSWDGNCLLFFFLSLVSKLLLVVKRPSLAL